MVDILRTCSQQLAQPEFDDAHQLASYMGAVQAQDVVMSKWALGIRLRQPSLSQVEQALDSGRIIRTHVLRPTWHMAAAEDIRWMIGLSGKRIRNAFLSWGKDFDITDRGYGRFCEAAARMLAGTDGLTKQEIAAALEQAGSSMHIGKVNCMLNMAEADGLLCSGKEKGKKNTYVLLDERVPAAAPVPNEEAAARLAEKYFRSHSPASLDDFVWWSGLPASDAKKAVQAVSSQLEAGCGENKDLFVHQCCTGGYAPDEEVHLLPPYDEYLISYKDRTHALPVELNRKAFTPYGIFFPVIYYQGKIVGNWKKTTKKGAVVVETELFDKKAEPGPKKLREAAGRYISFLKS